jgi:hypothetical protein
LKKHAISSKRVTDKHRPLLIRLDQAAGFGQDISSFNELTLPESSLFSIFIIPYYFAVVMTGGVAVFRT